MYEAVVAPTHPTLFSWWGYSLRMQRTDGTDPIRGWPWVNIDDFGCDKLHVLGSLSNARILKWV